MPSDQREAIAQAIRVKANELGLLQSGGEAGLADAVLPLVAAAEHRGKSQGWADANAQMQASIEQAEQRGYERGKAEGYDEGYRDALAGDSEGP